MAGGTLPPPRTNTSQKNISTFCGLASSGSHANFARFQLCASRHFLNFSSYFMLGEYSTPTSLLVLNDTDSFRIMKNTPQKQTEIRGIKLKQGQTDA